jgi:hypothetical protein
LAWLRGLREAEWFTAGRAREDAVLLALGLLVVTLGTMLIPGFSAPGGDFLSFYAASALAHAGQAADAWRLAAHLAAEHAVVPGASYYGFFYPPPYLLVCYPLAALPFGVAQLAWMAGTLLLAWLGTAPYLRALRFSGAETALLLAMPALWVNAMNGQNGALMLAIAAGGLALLDRRPVLAGLLLAGLAMKPQLGLALPFVLVASGRWRTLTAAAAGSVLLYLAALPLVGLAGYEAFFANLLNARAALGGAVNPALMQSLFAALGRYGAPEILAGAAQAALAGAVLVVAMATAWRRRRDGAALAALGVSASLLVTPFLFDYDLTLTALPIAWLLAEARDLGFRPWEKLGLVLIVMLPLGERLLALDAGLQLAPLPLIGLFVAVVTRCRDEAAGAVRAPIGSKRKLEVP